MTDSPSDTLSTHFDEPGTIPKPGPVGRAVRLGWGILLVAAVWNAVRYHFVFLDSDIPYWTTWIGIAIALMVTPYVVNIGWGRNWRSVPRLVAMLGIGAGVIASRLFLGAWWSEALGWAVLVWYVYTLGHLGISFLLAAVLATPGCEMRAIPHLWTTVTGRPTREHICPGHIARVDSWERARHAS
ncbi:MAG: hypothetical protein HKP01_05050 [Gemmatimonadetes bacterium]|nr:hypothetical protein [Gemmatimonadota bacterium]